MGAVKCPVHGLTIGIDEACPHVAAQIRSGSLGPHHEAGQLLLCDPCMDPRLAPYEGEQMPSFFGPPSPEQDAAWKAYDELHPSLDVACVQCRAAAMNNYARKAGLPEPWPSFERTLTGNEQDAPHVAQLRERVEGVREWRQSVVRPEYSSCTVSAGAYTYPLTVRCYYVVDPDEQYALVQLVRDFLAGHAKNQGVVRFIEAENWITTPGGGGRRGPETVLLEVFINCGSQPS